MDEPKVISVRVRDLKQSMPFQLETGVHHKIVLVRSKAMVLDAEDQHFNSDRCVLLPDLPDASQPPVLDKRRLKGLDVMYAALVHAEANPSQGLLVAGHTDPSGKVGHNRRLSEARAKNVWLLLRGKRDDWKKHADEFGATDDYQAILAWQSRRAGWDCDPGPINNRRGKKTVKAVRAFQTQYNQLAESAKEDSLDSPYQATITVDGKVGPETWGAFYDVYMSELMSLLELENYSDLVKRQQKLKAPPGMPDFVACGEHVPLDPAARDPYEKQEDEHLDGPPDHAGDRRVEILFFDPGEEASLPCKAKLTDCDPPACLLYGDHRFKLSPIGIPKGLALLEANLRLVFVDPEGKTRPFPKGVKVEVHFGDPANYKEPEPEPAGSGDASSGSGGAAGGASSPTTSEKSDAADDEDLVVPQNPVVETGDDGLLQFAVARQAATLFLRVVAGDKPFITCKPDDLAAQEQVSADDLAKSVGEGRVAFQLPAALTTLDGQWKPAPELKFDRGMFTDINNRQTQIGSRGAPAEMKLEMLWQYFRFDYYDRWTSTQTSVPQPRTKDKDGKDVLPLILEGHSSLLDPANVPTTYDGKTVWDLKSGDATIHCLGWARRRMVLPDGKERQLPDEKCTVRFFVESAKSLYVRTEGDGKDASSPRAFALLDMDGTTMITPNAERLRYYDLPDDWRSNDYPCRLAEEDASKLRPFQKVVATESTLANPYVISLDTLVLGGEKPSEPDKTIAFDDSKMENRFSIRDGKLAVWKPHEKDTYFTKLGDLVPKPTGSVLCDVPPNARLITRGKYLYHAFDRRLGAFAESKGFPVGARYAVRFELSSTGVEERKPFFHLNFEYHAPKPDGSLGNSWTGHGSMGLLRCGGHEGDVETFALFSYTTVACNYAPALPYPSAKAKPLPAAPPDAADTERKCLLAMSARWNGSDSYNTAQPSFVVGDPATAKGTWTALLLPGALTGTNTALLTIDVFKEIRAAIRGVSATGYWELKDMEPTKGGKYDGWFTAAHELGHVMGQPDEYTNKDYEPCLYLPNITESARSPGSPYGLDEKAMMTGNRLIRPRYYWHLALWAQGNAAFPGKPKIVVNHGTSKFTTEVTLPHKSRVQWPVATTPNPNANASATGSPWSGVPVGTFGLCDEFLYLTCMDEGLASVLDGAAYDGFVMVRVKMAWTFTPTHDFDAMYSLLSRAESGILSAFNLDSSRKLVFVGALGTQPVRLRVLFAPRFVCRTFPTGGKNATAYLEGIDYEPIPKPFTREGYAARVAAGVKDHGLHAEIEVVDSGTPGVTAGVSPRTARVRRDGTTLLIFNDARFDQDVLRVFAQLVGLPDQQTSNPLVFQHLANAIPGLVATPEYG